jgi:hypothetical protein
MGESLDPQLRELPRGSGHHAKAPALVASRISAFFTPPLYEALAESNYFGVAALPPGGFL